MNLNNLDTWFSENRKRCCILFACFAITGMIWAFGMIRCSSSVVYFSDPYSYILLFDDPNITHFFLGRLVFNAMEYLYAGKGMVWIFLKSLSVLDVVWLMLGVLILFQDSSHLYVSRMRMFTIILMISSVLIVAVYSLFLAFASIQLTTEAGFSLLYKAGRYGQIAGAGLECCSLFMMFMMMLKKK